MSTAWRLLRLLQPFAGWVALSVLLSVATVAAGVGLLGTSAYLIASAALHPAVGALQVAIVGVRFFGISRGVFRYLERLVSHSANFRLLARLRVTAYQALEPLAPARLQRFQSGDLLGRATADIDILENFYVRVVAPPLVALIVTSSMGLFAGSYAAQLGLVAALGLALGGLLPPLAAHWLGSAPGRELVQQDSRLRAALVDGVQGMSELVAYGREAQRIEEVEALGAARSQAQMRLAWAGGASSALALLTASGTVWALLLVAIPLVRGKELSGVSLAVLALAVAAAFEAVAPLGPAAQQLGRSLEAARRLFALVDARPEVCAPSQPLPAPRSAGLSIRGLRFQYAPGLPPALDCLDLELPPGKKVALVGPSGAGKSTLANLLLRFWDFDEGEIRLDGRDLRAYAPEDVRREISLVSQSTDLFSGSIRYNLLMAAPAASQGELLLALERAGLGEWADCLPQGLDTWIGERGLAISGGERQRLAVARCLLREAPLLLLDEPTANLDTLTEQRLVQTLLEAMQGRSVLWITHRLIGLEHMDEILVLDEGRVVERGTQAQLIEQAGLFASLWSLQNRILFEPPGTESSPGAF